MAKSKKLKDGDTVIFKQDVECEIFRNENSQRGKVELVVKGEEADIFDLQKNSDFVGVQFPNGEVTFVSKKFIEPL